MDRFAQDFLRRHPDAVVVHIGCGLDTRFERVDNGLVEWYDLDLLEVIEQGVFMYFTEAQVKSLVLTLRDHFPGAELVFDAWRPFEIWLGNFVLGGLLRWGFWRGQELEAWGDGIRLLDEWGFFDQPEPRLHPFRWMAPLWRLLKPMRVFHFQLGKAAG